MEKNNEVVVINNFCNELGSLNICDHVDKRLNLDPNDNYELFAVLIKHAREKHSPKIKVKFWFWFWFILRRAHLEHSTEV